MKQGFDTQDVRLKQVVTTCVQTEISTQMADLKSSITDKMDTQDKKLVQVGTDLTQIKEGIVTDKLAQEQKIEGIKKSFEAGMVTLQQQIATSGASTSQSTPTAPGNNPYTSSSNLAITVDGVRENRIESIESLLQKCNDRVFDIMGLNYQEHHVNECFRLGRDVDLPNDEDDDTSRPRTIKIKFNSPSAKAMVMRRRFRLREKKVYVSEFHPEDVEKKRRRLYPILKKARSLPHYKGRIHIEKDKLVLNGEEIDVKDFHKLPPDIHPKNICTETRGDVTFFFKADSPLSNHHACEVQIFDQKFNSSEQAYFWKKADVCKDPGAKTKILEAEDPGYQKFLGSRVQDTIAWTNMRVDVMTQICLAKFTQNAELRDFLLQTSPTYLAEDNPGDSFWSIKMSRNHPDSLNKNLYKSNHMGILLMKIRDNLMV
jgi:hypothetical protein